MRHDTFTRRKVVNALASISVGAMANPFVSSLAAAAETGTRMVAAIFFESYKTVALRRALRYAGDDGFVASMPQLLHARVNASYENIIWNTWFTAYSEENVVTTPQGDHVVVAVHGGGIFARPERFERSLRADLSRRNPEGLTGQYAAKITKQEAHDLLKGKLPDGSEIPIYSFSEFKRGVAEIPVRYGVVLDFDVAKKGERGYVSCDVLEDDPNMIVRAGGVEPLVAYLDKFKRRHNTELMGNWHSYQWIDPDQPQSRILTLGGNKGGIGSEGKDPGLGWGYDADDGIGTSWLGGMARYVAVAPRDPSTSLRFLDFKL
ncbi:MAG: hypothetical protein ACE5FV_05445 [Woeseia sp.]